MAFIDHNHASVLGSYLHCPDCNTPKVAKQGQDGRTGKRIWYLGCECTTPNSIVTLFHRKKESTLI